MKIIGVDPSLTSTGIAVVEDGVLVETYVIETDMPHGDIDRMIKIVKRFIHNELIEEKTKPDLIVMEDISYGSKGIIAQLSGLNYILRYIFKEYNIKFVAIPPKSLKMFITDNGSASKELMRDVVCDKYECGSVFDGKIKKVSDIVDAFALAKMAEEILNNRNYEGFTAKQELAVKKIQKRIHPIIDIHEESMEI